MHKLVASIYKEALLLTRDIGGIAILFIMPLVLVITITLIQDSTFKTVSASKIPVVFVDKDNGEVSQYIFNGLLASNSFEIIKKTSEEEAATLVLKGDYQLAVVIPEDLSVDLQKEISNNVENVLSKFGLESDTVKTESKIKIEKEVKLYFDPATQGTFKSAVINGIEKMVSQIETQSIYKAFQSQLGEEDTLIFDTKSFITFKEINPSNRNQEIKPNVSQHNVPAWALFAIFFIIVPLSINIVKEKNQGTFVRLQTQPVSYFTLLAGKTIVYLGVCLIQFTLMLLIGIYVFPYIGLPKITIFERLPLLYLVAVFAGLAAIGLGILLGTLAKTQEQSAPFGATFVVILAALGGVWVPVFAMPKGMQALSNISPMNWGLRAFYDVFLRKTSFFEVLPEITMLFLFFVVTSAIAIFYYKKKNAI
ncbi:MAG: ABC transporter permease [Flavobacteriaceae bacterium]|nr:ABC transporter permease [Flavobacteriaceae bacterium]